MRRDITITYNSENSTITAPSVTDVKVEISDAVTNNDYSKYNVPDSKLTAFSSLVSSINTFINSLTN